MKFKVTFEATGFTNSHTLADQAFSQQEAESFTEAALAEGSFPKNVLAVLGGRIAEDDDQGGKDIRVFVCVDLLIEAKNEVSAERVRPSAVLLEKISDRMSSESNLDLLAGSWEVTEVDEPSAEDLSRDRPRG